MKRRMNEIKTWRLGISMVIACAFVIAPLSSVYAQSFGEQLYDAAQDLDPDARVEFEALLSDPETFGEVLDDFGVSPEMADNMLNSVFSGRWPDGEQKAKWTNRSDYLEKLRKRLTKIEDKMDSKAADLADKEARKAAKLAAKLAKKTDKVEDKVDKEEDKDKDKDKDKTK